MLIHTCSQKQYVQLKINNINKNNKKQPNNAVCMDLFKTLALKIDRWLRLGVCFTGSTFRRDEESIMELTGQGLKA